MTARKQHLRRAGYEALRAIRDSMPDGITAGALADRWGVTKNVMMRTVCRCEALQLAMPIPSRTSTGKAVKLWKLTAKGQQALDEFLAVQNTPKVEPEEDESEPKWPRANPEEVVRQAVRTQPTSVFDMARMMWQWRG